MKFVLQVTLTNLSFLLFLPRLALAFNPGECTCGGIFTCGPNECDCSSFLGTCTCRGEGWSGLCHKTDDCCNPPAPTTSTPTTGSPTTRAPSTAPPSTAAPTTASPTTVAPTTGSPTTAAPSTSPPTTGTPTTATPTTASPTTGAPSTAAPSTAAPTTASPTTLAPTTGSPTTAAPSTSTPTTGTPTTATPTTAAPTTGSPTTGNPTTSIPTTVAPSTSAPTTSIKAYNVVIMGDSFISGVGARGSDGNPNYEGPHLCGRSPTSWAAQLAEAAQVESYINVACGGARIEHITEPFRKGRPENKDAEGNCPPTNPNDDEYYLPNDEGTCDRMVLPQVHAITESTDYVLLSIGANDIGGIDVAARCFYPFYRSARSCKSAFLNSFSKFEKLKEELSNALDAIEERLPSHGKIILFYYPLFVLPTGYSLSHWWTREKAENLDQRFRGMATMLNWAVSRASAGHRKVQIYDKTPEDFAGHEIYPESNEENAESWLYEPFDGFPFVDLPDSLKPEDIEAWLLGVASDVVDFFHVNAKGHTEFALKVQQNLG